MFSELIHSTQFMCDTLNENRFYVASDINANVDCLSLKSKRLAKAVIGMFRLSLSLSSSSSSIIFLIMYVHSFSIQFLNIHRAANFKEDKIINENYSGRDCCSGSFSDSSRACRVRHKRIRVGFPT